MRLTAYTDYGLRALMRMAGEPDRTFTTEEIAREFRISRNHLTKVVRDLADAGFVETQRGASGGLRLARPAGEITLGAVVRHLEARHAMVECFRPDRGECVALPKCRLRSRLGRAAEAFLAELDRSSIADCALGPLPAPPLRAAALEER